MYKVSDIRIDIPKYPKLIIDTLEKNGYEAYIVGGCVRDALLGKIPSDYDITTNASPGEVKKLFRRTIDTGIQHGTITVLFYDNDKPLTYEVTTFRIDGEYDDSRHPKNVVFVDDLKEDLLRRDFTVNAMAYNDKRGLVDEFGGLIDLEKKIIRAVGNPYDRFKEDALRLLRAIRFAAKLGFSIDEETIEAIPKLSYNLLNVSKERVQVELSKTITSENPDFIKMVFSLGLSTYISRYLNDFKLGNISKCRPLHLAYACLLYNLDIDRISLFLKEIKLDNNNIHRIIALIKAKESYRTISVYYASKNFEALNMAVKELINFLSYDLAEDFIELVCLNEENEEFNNYLKDKIYKLKTEKCPIFLSDIDIDGEDIKCIGFVGQEIGMALHYLLKIVHKNRKYNDKKLLQEIAKKAYNIYKRSI